MSDLVLACVWQTLKTAGLYLQLFVLCCKSLLNSNLFPGGCT